MRKEKTNTGSNPVLTANCPLNWTVECGKI
jgi:hypothetical protein